MPSGKQSKRRRAVEEASTEPGPRRASPRVPITRADAVQETPTVLVGKTGGTLTQVKLLSSVDGDSVAKAVDAALGQG